MNEPVVTYSSQTPLRASQFSISKREFLFIIAKKATRKVGFWCH